MNISQAYRSQSSWLGRFLLLLIGCSLAGFLAAAFLFISPLWLWVGLGALSALALWFVILHRGHDFEVLLLGLFLIGYFQGYTSKLLGDAVPQSIWGMAKYCLLGLMLVGYLVGVGQGWRVRANRAMLLWFGIWILFSGLSALLMIEAMMAEPRYNPVGTIQQFGMGNMLLAVLVYLRAKPNQVDRWLRVLIWMGFLAAGFGVFQRLLGAERLALLGLSQEILLTSMAFLPIDNAETGFLDLQNGLRAFSFFDTHHAFSGFLVLSILALQIQRLRALVKPLFYWIGMALLVGGLALSFNLTNMLTCLLTLFLFGVLQQGGRLQTLIKMALSKKYWRIALSIGFIVLIVIVAYAPLRDRLLGVLDVRQGSAGAGGSFAYRLEGAVSGIQAVIDYPLGFGLFLNSTYSVLTNSELNRYVRVNDYFAKRGVFFSGDNWFQWLMVQIGLPGFALYSLLFLVPIVWGWRFRNRVRRYDLRTIMHGCLALLIIVFIAGVSNSPILAFPPANLLFWGFVGLLFKIPTWDRKMFDQNAYRN